jgi:hypothetical protein
MNTQIFNEAGGDIVWSNVASDIQNEINSSDSTYWIITAIYADRTSTEGPHPKLFIIADDEGGNYHRVYSFDNYELSIIQDEEISISGDDETFDPPLYTIRVYSNPLESTKGNRRLRSLYRAK